MKIIERPIAITDVETTGLDPMFQEIVEIGLVLIDQQTHKVLDRYSVKVHPLHPERASEFALKLNGYNALDWRGALPLRKAMERYAYMTKDAIFCAHNVTFDWSFISQAFKNTAVKSEMDYHRIDLFTMAWMKLKDSGLQKLNQDEVAKFLGIPEEPVPHRAINGAMTAYEIYKKLLAYGHYF